MHKRFLLALLSSVLIVGPASAGPITVFTEIWSAGGNNTGQIPVSGLGNWATLTWGTSPGPTLTLPAGQTSVLQAVVGLLAIAAQFRQPRPASGPKLEGRDCTSDAGATSTLRYGDMAVTGCRTRRSSGCSSTPQSRARSAPRWDWNTLNWQFAAQPGVGHVRGRYGRLHQLPGG